MERFFTIQAEGERISATKYSKKRDAEYDAKKSANLLNKKVTVLEVCYCSEKEPEDINITTNSYEAAIEYLGRESGECVHKMANKHRKAMEAMYKLIVIAEAWNKADKFIPDCDNINQYKWFPWFRKKGDVNFVCAAMDNTAASAFAAVGSRLCFKTKERAEQFGKQFVDLWNDFLL